MWKQVEDQEGVRRGQEGPKEVRKAVGEGRRGGKAWESNTTLQVSRIYCNKTIRLFFNFIVN